MARVSLPPGFRFHPTDVELIMYLRRKFMGKLGRFNYILEIDIYKFAPWDLPDKSYLKSRDLEWYFYCPRNRKYSNGARTNRATDIGYWKTTGKDRPICDNNNQTVGMKKTLIFHLGRPQGERTNWVMHEYRLEEKGLADIGISPDEYVICKFFEKSGPGPKNGEQHGAPFKEEDWDDEVGNDSLACFPIAGAPLPLGSEDNQVMVVANSTAKVTEVEPVVKISEVDAVPQQSTGSAVVEEHFTLPENDALNEMLLNFFPVDDGGLSMDDGGLVSHVNGNNENLETTKLHEIALENPTHMEEADIYIGLEDLSPPPNPVDRFHFHHALEDVYAPYQVLPDAHGYLELNDLKYPMEAVNSGYDTSNRHQNFSNLEDFPNSGAPLCSTLSDSGSCSMLSGRSDIYEDPPLTVVSEMDCFRGRSYASWEFQANPDHSAAAPLIIKQANLFCRLPQAIPYPHRHSD